MINHPPSNHPFKRYLPVAICYAAVVYNAVLAIINASVTPLNFSIVAICEALILMVAGLCLAIQPVRNPKTAPVAILIIGVSLFLFLSVANQVLSLESFRNFAIIAIFTLLGQQIERRDIHLLFLMLSASILFFLVLEIVSVEAYVALFQPSKYYLQTRGMEEFALDDSGLFRNALGFDGRFSFGIAGHRTASLYLEQVSLANYAGVLSIYLISYGRDAGRRLVALHLITVVGIALTNDSRTSLMLIGLFAIGNFVFPYLNRKLVFFFAPTVLILGAIVARFSNGSEGDDLVGRVTGSMKAITSLDIWGVLGFEIDHIYEYMDSGYSFLTVSSTMFGAIAFWIYCCCCVINNEDRSSRSLLFGLNIYIFINLMIGGTAIFSIKVAAPLWMLVGYSRGGVSLMKPVLWMRRMVPSGRVLNLRGPVPVTTLYG